MPFSFLPPVTSLISIAQYPTMKHAQQVAWRLLHISDLYAET